MADHHGSAANIMQSRTAAALMAAVMLLALPAGTFAHGYMKVGYCNRGTFCFKRCITTANLQSSGSHKMCTELDPSPDNSCAGADVKELARRRCTDNPPSHRIALVCMLQLLRSAGSSPMVSRRAQAVHSIDVCFRAGQRQQSFYSPQKFYSPMSLNRWVQTHQCTS